MFLIDKYNPTNIKNAYFHNELLELLKLMSQDESIPHLIFYGPEGCGKKTIIKMFLEMLFDKDVNNTKDATYTVISSGNKVNEILVKQSNHHIVIEPNNTNFDRYLIQHIVKEYARRVPLDIFKVNRAFKIVLINNLDNLSYYAQTSLRRTIENYSHTCRFVMWCNSLSRVIEPLRSRCTCKRVAAPTEDRLMQYINYVSNLENIDITLDDLLKINKNSNRNIKKALWLLELKKAKLSYKTIYDKTIKNISELILKKDLNEIQNIRNLIYNILITNIEGNKIIQNIVLELIKNNDINDELKYKMIEAGTNYEHNLLRGRHEIIHLEGFVMSIISIIN